MEARAVFLDCEDVRHGGWRVGSKRSFFDHFHGGEFAGDAVDEDGRGVVGSSKFLDGFWSPVLGDEQKIIGYKDPRITLNFRANDLKPSLDIQFKKKIDLSTLLPDGAEQVDIEAAWEPFLPSGTFRLTVRQVQYGLIFCFCYR